MKKPPVTKSVRNATREVFGFRVDYPLEIVPGAEARDSLRYHVHSPTLFLDDQELDERGVPRKCYRLLGPQYNPLFVAWRGLHHLDRWIIDGDRAHRRVFETQLDWLRATAERSESRGVVWPCRFDWQEGLARLEAPWISAMYQGVAISALVRGHRLRRDPELVDLALAATRVFGQDVADGGVRVREGDASIYEEYPAFPLPRVLDGFLFSLVGLYDLFVETGSGEVEALFRDGVRGLVRRIHWWSYRGKWSWYGSHRYLCPPHYHRVNCALLSILHRLSGEPELAAVARSWEPSRLGRRDRAEIFLVFALTKNWARLSLPSEQAS